MKKKIVIFNSIGGGGHISVTRALKKYLEQDYDVIISDVFSEVLAPIDIIRTITRGKVHGEFIYNFLVKKKWNFFLNRVCLPPFIWYLRSFRKNIKKLLENYFDEQKPDVVISAVPFINDFILEVAQEKNLYFLLIPTDFDINTFIRHIKHPNYHNFMIALPFKDQHVESFLAKAHILPNNYTITGFVLRPDFFEHKNTASIKRTYHIPAGKPVVLLMFGAVGSQELYTFAQHLTYVKEPAHLFICIGREEYLRKKIESIPFPAHISTTIVGFIHEVSDIMAVSDLIITKSGSVTVAEALYMNLPMLLDATSEVLKWEYYNHTFIEKQGFGISLTNLKHLSGLLDSLLKDDNRLHQFRQNLEHVDKKNGGVEIKKLIDKLLS